MPERRAVAEAALETVEKLSRQCDFRYENEDLSVFPERFGNRLEIDLRLAGTRDAIEEGDGEGAVGDALA